MCGLSKWSTITATPVLNHFALILFFYNIRSPSLFRSLYGGNTEDLSDLVSVLGLISQALLDLLENHVDLHVPNQMQD